MDLIQRQEGEGISTPSQVAGTNWVEVSYPSQRRYRTLRNSMLEGLFGGERGDCLELREKKQFPGIRTR